MMLTPVKTHLSAALFASGALINHTAVQTAPLPGGTVDPLSIPKYVIPLVIPPVMNNAGTSDDYDIAVRQFKQQILPGGIWNTLNGRKDKFKATTVWSYGPAADPLPDSRGFGGKKGVAPAPNSQFNYPAYTIEARKNRPVSVDWVNDLKNPKNGKYLQHLIPVDQTLHWANPLADCISGSPRTDCRGDNELVYKGPVPIVTHVHGAHVGPESDGYPEAWWLPDPAGSNFLCTSDPTQAGKKRGGRVMYMCEGSLANGYGAANTNVTPGVASYTYRNDQPSTTLWYHDHSLGMTRNNLYAGPAGFWLIRKPNGGENGLKRGILPGPAPVAGEDLVTTNFPQSLGGSRHKYREIPIMIQDRSFNKKGADLFYPANRAFFEGLGNGQKSGRKANKKAGLKIATIGNKKGIGSDISPIWNPEAFFNTMVVNGTTWPQLNVARASYRFRLLNGSNSRFLNLALFKVRNDGSLGREIPIFQIGADQSLLPNVVRIKTGKKNGAAVNPDEALLMGPAERADTIVDFSNLPDGTVVRMINTAPDAPFGGFPDVPADPSTTGQVMQFVVTASLTGLSPTDPGPCQPQACNDDGSGDATKPSRLKLKLVDKNDPANAPGPGDAVRDLALLEEKSAEVCVIVKPNGKIKQLFRVLPGPHFLADCANAGGVPFAPKAAVLGSNGAGGGAVQLWSDPIRQNPGLGDTETWELWNRTADAHPIHMHLVKFRIKERQAIAGAVRPPEATEAGWKDTVIAYPGEITRVKASFDVEGLYVWHCHIVEHEDNEMMVPYCVGDLNSAPGCTGL